MFSVRSEVASGLSTLLKARKGRSEAIVWVIIRMGPGQNVLVILVSFNIVMLRLRIVPLAMKYKHYKGVSKVWN